MNDVIRISEYVIRISNEKGYKISNLRLQKILYYIQGYSLKFLNKKAFEGDIQKWQYGPSVLLSYFKYCMYEHEPLVYEYEIYLPKDKCLLYNKVIDLCNKIKTKDLVLMTLEESPSKTTEIGEYIKIEKIKEFFYTNDPLKIGGC